MIGEVFVRIFPKTERDKEEQVESNQEMSSK
jgi:hypothetical protein